MERRNFLKASGLTALALGMGSWTGLFAQKRLPRNWAWGGVHENMSDDELLKAFDRYKSHGIDALLPEGDNAFYARISRLGKKAGIEIHAWRWTMNRGQYIRDHPEWYAVNRKGESCAGPNPPYVNYYRWLCPSQEEVKDAIVKDYIELCDIPELSGVHLDYVRYCDVYLPKELQPKYHLVQDHEMPEYDYCYCNTCRRLFREKTGIDPLDLEDPASNVAWRDFRLNQLVRLVQAIVEEVHRKDKLITAAVFPTPAMSRTMVRQDWPKFGLDAYLPMLYHHFYGEKESWIGQCVKESLTELPKGTPVYAGIFRGALKTADLASIYTMVKENGGMGLSFFTADSLSDTDLKILKRALET